LKLESLIIRDESITTELRISIIMSAQTVRKNTVVTIRFKLFDPATGELIDDENNGISYLHGGYDEIFPLVEAACEGQSISHRFEVSLQPEDAFGEYSEDMVREESLAELEMPDIEEGMILETEDEETGDPVYWEVLEIKGDKVVLDGNHPLAGLPIKFQGEILSIRDATSTEIEHGHSHDEDDEAH
jgi:FKBP-type peptidyl-prolyl cis-trans isomerase SlyD